MNTSMVSSISDNFTHFTINTSYSSNTSNISSNNNNEKYSETFGIQRIFLVVLLSVVILIVIIGNTLVITAVFTTKRLRTVTNCFVMSLAVADWLVGIFVMPPAVAYLIVGSWELGWILCDIWVSLDILLCTASILSLCVISVDRYLAITQPLSYSKKRRSKQLAFIMILMVWASSALITAPPMFGWYEPGRHNLKTCRYNKNTGYVIFSAMGSFFIPMIVMLYVYVRISCVIAQRHDKLSHINTSCSREERPNGITIEELDDGERYSNNEGELKSLSMMDIYDNNKDMETGTPSRNSARLLMKANTNYSLQDHKPNLNVKCLNSFRSSLPVKHGNNMDKQAREFIMLNYEPASRVSSIRRETKTAQTLSIVMGGFILCWLPFFIYYLLTPFIQANQLIMQYFTWLGWINSAINPFIYAFYSPDFRIAFCRLTINHFKKNVRDRAEFLDPPHIQKRMELD